MRLVPRRSILGLRLAFPVIPAVGPVSIAILALFLLSGCGEREESRDAAPAMEESRDAIPDLEVEVVREGSEVVSGAVAREEAERIALEAVGSGRVTWSGPEDDRGAAWEVEVTRPDGSEVDVLVAADGSVVKEIEKFGRGAPMGGGGDVPAGGVVSREQAEEAALEAVGEGRVTWVGREDERGAAWEVEITRPDGSEIDVLIAPDGSVIR